MNAAIYARTSKEDPKFKKTSIDQQVEHGKLLAENSKGELTVADEHIFIDRDLSGKLYPPQWTKERKTRPQFGKLIEAIEKGDVQAVIFRMRDRIARNTVLSLKFYEFCQDHQIKIYATDETITQASDASGKFALTVLIAAAQLQLDQTQANVKASKKYSKEHGLKVGPLFTVGYKQGGRGVILQDPEGVEIVNEIYDKYIAGMSKRQIRDYCQKHYPDKHPRNGKKWHHSTIARILTNKAYIAQSCQPFPLIVDLEKWLTCQKHIIARRNMKFGGLIQKHLLTGLLVCGIDGRPMVTYSRYSQPYKAGEKGQRTRFEYKCPEKHDKNTSPVTMGEAQWLAFIDEWIAITKITKPPTKSTLDLELKREKIQKNKEALDQQVQDGSMTWPERHNFLAGFNSELSKIDAEILRITAEDQIQVKQWGDMTFEEKRQHLFTMVQRIVVFRHGVFVYFKSYSNPVAPWNQEIFSSISPEYPRYWPAIKVPSRGPRKANSFPAFPVFDDKSDKMQTTFMLEKARIENVDCLAIKLVNVSGGSRHMLPSLIDGHCEDSVEDMEKDNPV